MDKKLALMIDLANNCDMHINLSIVLAWTHDRTDWCNSIPEAYGTPT